MLKNENEVIEQARHGDNKALTQLVNYYSPKIYNLGLRIMRHANDAEDVLQDTFLTMVRKIHTFEGRSSLYTWLYRVATNKALEKLKNKKQDQITDSLDDPDFTKFDKLKSLDLPDFTDDKLSDKQFLKYLDKAMIELNDKLRAVFVLRDIEGNSVSDTARMLGLTESNVKVRTMRARLFLREKLSTIFKEEGWA